MARRLQAATEGVVEMDSRLERLTNQMDELEESRIAILPEANKRLMVYVPPGPFTMGGRDEDSPRNEQPAHTVHLTGYYIGKMPVTNQEYREFVQCTGYRAPIHWQRGTFPTGMGKHPVTNVTWRDACAYAAWRGAKLPTEAEWEKAARGTDERPYPWGEASPRGSAVMLAGSLAPRRQWTSFPRGEASTRPGTWPAMSTSGVPITMTRSSITIVRRPIPLDLKAGRRARFVADPTKRLGRPSAPRTARGRRRRRPRYDRIPRGNARNCGGVSGRSLGV